MIDNIFVISAKLTEGTKIFFVTLLIALSVGAMLLVIRSIIKEKRRWQSSQDAGGVLSVNQFEETVTNMILSNKKGNFTVLRIDIADSKNLIKTLGEMQYQSALTKFIHGLRLTLTSTAKIAQQNSHIIYILLKVKHTPSSLDTLCKMIFAESKKSIIIAGALKVEFDINIGAVSYPSDGKNMEELRQNIQLAAIAAQRKGLNKYAIYDFNLSNKETEEYKQYLEIKEAIENKDFTVYYQPIINLVTNEVEFVESLLRWNHKERGVLPPSSFLNIMEHTGDINWVGLWAIEQVFKQWSQWRTLYPEYNLNMCINLSQKQLMNSMLTEELRRILKRHKVTPANFTMEIGEVTIFDNNDNVLSNIQKISQMGFLIAIDNYKGTHSSMSNLANIDANIIKFSRSLIKEARNNELTKDIIDTLINYCKKNNKKIVSEGVEDQELYEYIISLGIEYGQGYYFAKPGDSRELMNAVVLTPWSGNMH